jgi:hypothetical protein
MHHHEAGSVLSRRTALTGLGAGGLGLVLAATAQHVSAQDTANHPVIGLWQNKTTGPDSDVMPWTFSQFHADGSYLEWNGLGAGAALGIWRPAGERTVDLLFVYRDTDPTAQTEGLGTATFQMTVEVDEAGDALTFGGDLDLRDPAGNLLLAIPDATWTATRVTFDHNPATGSTVTTPATPTTQRQGRPIGRWTRDAHVPRPGSTGTGPHRGERPRDAPTRLRTAFHRAADSSRPRRERPGAHGNLPRRDPRGHCRPRRSRRWSASGRRTTTGRGSSARPQRTPIWRGTLSAASRWRGFRTSPRMACPSRTMAGWSQSRSGIHSVRSSIRSLGQAQDWSAAIA